MVRQLILTKYTLTEGVEPLVFAMLHVKAITADVLLISSNESITDVRSRMHLSSHAD